MKKLLITGISIVAVLSSAGFSGAERTAANSEAAMRMSHVSMLLGHAVSMVADGSNLIMTASLNAAPPYDGMNAARGQQSFDHSRSLIQEALSGPEMTTMYDLGLEDDPEMQRLHLLGSQIQDYISIVEKMRVKEWDEGAKYMHYMHLIISHALMKAAEGFNLITLGNMKMGDGLDRFTVEHGRLMMKEAGPILASLEEGLTMSRLHSAGRGPTEDLFMNQTHKLLETAKNIIGLMREESGV